MKRLIAGVVLLGVPGFFQTGQVLAQQSLEDRVSTLESQFAESTGAGAMKVFWKDSLRFETLDGNTRIRFGGRMHLDTVWPVEEGDYRSITGDQKENVFFRRARLYVSGQVNQHTEFKFQYDFAGGDADFKDVYAGLKGLPFIGNIRAGQFKEPFSLEEVTSSNSITFMERALPNAFAPARKTGLMISNLYANDQLGIQLGVFKTGTDDYGDAGGNADWAWTGRLYGRPYVSENGTTFLHVGSSVSIRDPEGSDVRYRSRPEARPDAPLTSYPVDTMTMSGIKHEYRWNLESAFVMDAFSLQGEFSLTQLDTNSNATVQVDRNIPATVVPLGSDKSFAGWYVMATYMLTGEARRYDARNGAMKSPKVRNAFAPDEHGVWGNGGWELAARISGIDLDDGQARGGKMNNYTIGLNWYLNNNTRLMFNYIYSDLQRNRGTGDPGVPTFNHGHAKFFTTRLQLAF